MEDQAVVSARWWSEFWEAIEHWAFLGVVLTLAIEFAAAHFVKSPRRIVDQARELEIARLSNEAETARKQIAEANARASEAQLALEKLKAPRLLRVEQSARIADKIRPFKELKFDMSVLVGDPEAMFFLGQIANTLEAGGWHWIEWNHPTGPFMTVYALPGKPNVGQIGSVGVSILIHADHLSEFSDAADVLSAALNADGIIANVERDAPQGVPNHDTLHIVIGKKPL
jgi:hypothetical protein